MKNNEIRKYLINAGEESYKRFSSSLILDNKKPLIGVRLPALRKLGKLIAKDDPLEFLKTFPEEYFEDVMVKGFVISEGDFSFDERLELIREHISKIDNWSLCDSFVSSLKFIKTSKDEYLSFLEPYFKSWGEYEIRFAIVCLLFYYNSEEYIDNNLKVLSRIKCDCFYANMAAAWALAEFYASFPDKVYQFLKNDNLSDFTHNKAISKIRESNKISREEKDRVCLLKR